MLGRSERWLLDQVRTHGTKRFVVGVTLVIVAVSFVATMAAIVPLGALQQPSYLISGVVLSVLIPTCCAPPALSYTVRLVARLDAAAALLHEAAVTDTLTGVRNRRGFFESLPRAGGDGDVEVAMVDVDLFKQLNDQHGHDFGDRALRTVAAWLHAAVGDHGVVGRLGGDEFAFVARAGAVADFGHRQRLELAGVEVHLTVGRVLCPAGEDRELALIAADAELYQHKRSRPTGRDEPSVRRRLVETQHGNGGRAD